MSDAGNLTMSAKELDRLEIVRRVTERRLTQRTAAERLGLGLRQVERLCRAFRMDGAAGPVSRKRGRPSNRKLSEAIRERALQYVRGRYADFGPTLACEKLTEQHGFEISRKTLRRWMIDAGLWILRSQRLRRAHQPRHRRSCLGELVQIDGREHGWFEERGAKCTLLVYVDDATSRLMELRFVASERTASAAPRNERPLPADPEAVGSTELIPPFGGARTRKRARKEPRTVLSTRHFYLALTLDRPECG